MKKQLSLVWYSLIFFGIIFIDRITKYWALTYAREKVNFNQFLSFEVVFNRGISWGMLHSTSAMAFYTVTAIIGLIILFLAYFAYKRWQKHMIILGEVMALAGALSNMIDRFYYGGVVDYILLTIDAWDWPFFNIADVSIVAGILVMFLTTPKK